MTQTPTLASTTGDAPATDPRARRRIERRQTLERAWRMRHFYVLLVPMVVLLIVFKYVPMYGAGIAFVDYNIVKGVLGSTWNNFKWFSWDAGLCRSLRPVGPFDRPEELAGAALEGLVAEHLRTWIAYANTRDTLSYWRTRSGSEVDFVLYGESGLYALEVKNSATLHPGDLTGLRSFAQDYPEATPILLYRGRRVLERDILCLPCDAFLRALTPGRSFATVVDTA